MQDIVAGNAQRAEQQRSRKTCAVFAGGAVKHQRRAVVQQVAKESRIHRSGLAREAAVGLAHQRHRFGFGGFGTLRHQGLHAVHHRGFDGQRQRGEAVHIGRQRGTFGHATKVDAVRHAQALQCGSVLRRECREVVRAVHAPQAHAATVQTGEAAEVAEVGGALQQAGGYGEGVGQGRHGQHCRA